MVSDEGSAATLPPFPVDTFTLNQIEHALNTRRGPDNQPVGGEFTLPQLLLFLSGYDEQRKTFDGYIDSFVGLQPSYDDLDEIYMESDMVLALIAEIRRLRD